MRLIVYLGTAVALATTAPGIAKPADVRSAVAATAQRSADNVKLDAGRKPAELLAFLGLEPGMRVADMFGGNNYWGEILAPAVGPKGRVTIWLPTQFYDMNANANLTRLAASHPNVRACFFTSSKA